MRGLIGYRSLRMVGDAERLGIYGFGGEAHLLTQVARHQGRRVFASHMTTFPLDRANEALAELRSGAVQGAVVLEIG